MSEKEKGASSAGSSKPGQRSGKRGNTKSTRRKRSNRPSPPAFSDEQKQSRAQALTALKIAAPDLPVVARFDEIAELLKKHNVVVIAGETGSGKSTQLPQLLLREGYGQQGYIGLTQPRRLAATALASTLNEQVTMGESPEEGESPEGFTEVAGYQIRFQSTVQPHHLIKVMTDGVLLTEIRRDKWLNQYEVIIIDEAHERSTNIDLLLGYLKQLLRSRRNLKVIVTSATLDHERLQAFFDGAPLMEVTGRQYPVDIRYEDVGQLLGERPDSPEAVAWAVQEILPLLKSGELRGRDGLVFLPTERHILSAAQHLRKHMPAHISILPLYARLPQSEQRKIFHPTGRTRLILSTNVAETSLTVPNIGFVIDTGTARISQYSVHNKVQRLPIEAIAQSSAAQRAGRCGRIGPGVCLRLYSEQDFQKRDHHTKPEILRSHLASVLIQLLYLRLGDPEQFPFLDQPDPRLMRDGFQCLTQIGAVIPPGASGKGEQIQSDQTRRDQPQGAQRKGEQGNRSARRRRGYQLTDMGRRIAQLPLDPRLARILLAAAEFNCLEEQLILVSFLGVQDPRERSFWDDVRQAQVFKDFYDDQSDFMAVLKLWQWARTEKTEQTRRAFQKSCRALGINLARLFEWFGLHRQLVFWVNRQGMTRNKAPASYEQIHRALLCGWPLEIATLHPEGFYQGVRGRKLQIFPGNPLKRKKFPWLLVGEIIETEKQFAHRIAKIDPLWIEAAADALVKRTVGEPFWDKKRQQVRVHERGELLGLRLYGKRARSLAAIDPVAARMALIRFALVEKLWRSGLPFEAKNAEVLAVVDQWEHKLRRLDLRADDQILVDFFDAQLPADITDCRRLKRWAQKTIDAKPTASVSADKSPDKSADKNADKYACTTAKTSVINGDALCFDLQTVLAPYGISLDLALWPDTWLPRVYPEGMKPFVLSYHFDMSDDRDGITIHVPESRMNALGAAELTWLVPGYWPDLIAACVRAMPKASRRRVPPMPNWRQACLDWLTERAKGAGGIKGQANRQESFQQALTIFWQQQYSIDIPVTEIDALKLPEWLRFWISVQGVNGKVLAQGRDWEAVSGQTVHHAQEIDLGQTLPDAAPASSNQGGLPVGVFREWSFGDLPKALTELSDGASHAKCTKHAKTNRAKGKGGKPPEKGGEVLAGYCAFVDHGEGVQVSAFTQWGAAQEAHHAGLTRLFLLRAVQAVRAIKKQADVKKLGLLFGMSPETLLTQTLAKAVDICFIQKMDDLYAQAAFDACWDDRRNQFMTTHQELVQTLSALAEQAQAVRSHLLKLNSPALEAPKAAMTAQLNALLTEDFIAQTPPQWLSRYPVYCQGILARIERLQGNLTRDAQDEATVKALEAQFHSAMAQRAFPSDALKAVRWLLEELRLSFFAQRLKTLGKISPKRIQKVLDDHR